MAINIQKKRKGPLYASVVFFPSGSPKKWRYVSNLKSFSEFLDKQHSSWLYMNIYAKGSHEFLKRFYKGNMIPKTLVLLGLLFGSCFLTTIRNQTFALPSTFSKQVVCPMKNTFALPATFINDFNYSATIPTPFGGAKSC